MKNKNWVTSVLMVSSIVLLVGLQVVWLKSLHKDAKRELRRETSFLFSTTVIAMQDSILEKNIKPLSGDSTEKFAGIKARHDSTLREHHKHIEIRRRTRGGDVFFFNTDRPDSIKKFLRPLMMKIKRGDKREGFSIMINLDSLKPEAIKKNYERALIKAGISLPFIIEFTKGHTGQHKEGPGLTTEPFPFFQHGPFYVAHFSNVSFFIWKKLSLQLLFSMFLTSLTVAAFYLMYRSIRSNQRLLEIKNDFIGNMTHELKTPITTVGVALESLKNFSALDDRQRTKDYIEMAQQELNRLSILTDKVLKTAIFESNGLAFESIKVDVEKIASRVIDSMKLLFEQKQAKVNFIREENSFFVNGNEDHLTNVIYNLLDNALKYNRGIPEIEVILKAWEGKVVISVRDQGIGIAPEHQKRIFEKFYRVPTGDVANTKGYGLGLNYVYKVVKLHQGDVKVESALNEGTTFVITLPQLA